MGMGGGSKTATSTQGLAPEFKPYLQRALADAESARMAEAASGPSATRRESADILNRASTKDQVYQQALAQQQGQQALGGKLGSARAQRAALAAASDVSQGRQSQEDQQRLQAAQAYEDAPHRSLERFFGYLGNAPKQSTSTQPGGK